MVSTYFFSRYAITRSLSRKRQLTSASGVSLVEFALICSLLIAVALIPFLDQVVPGLGRLDEETSIRTAFSSYTSRDLPVGVVDPGGIRGFESDADIQDVLTNHSADLHGLTNGDVGFCSALLFSLANSPVIQFRSAFGFAGGAPLIDCATDIDEVPDLAVSQIESMVASQTTNLEMFTVSFPTGGRWGGPATAETLRIYSLYGTLYRSIDSPDDPAQGGDGVGGGLGSGGCFTAETEVSMADSSVRLISELSKGDKVWGVDLKTGLQKIGEVRRVFTHQREGFYVLNERLRVTGEHPFYVIGKGWVETRDLKRGDDLWREDGRIEPVTNLFYVSEPLRVWNIEVSDHHTYFAGGVLVHNKPPLERSMENF